MKLLLDENLSPRLVNRLNQLFPGLAHVRDVGLKQADDSAIWEWAKVNEFAIITTDFDFVALAQRLGYFGLAGSTRGGCQAETIQQFSENNV